MCKTSRTAGRITAGSFIMDTAGEVVMDVATVPAAPDIDDSESAVV